MNIAAFKVPLQPTAQKVNISLGSTAYNLTALWREVPQQADQGGWFLDIADANNVPILSGLPLITGADLLAQYGYLGIGGKLVVQSDSNPDETPSYSDLGTTSNLYWIPNA